MTRRLKIEFMALLFLGGALFGRALSGAYDTDYFDPLVDIHHEISQLYFEEPDQQAMLEGAIEGMITRLNDPHTSYLKPEVVAEFDKQTRASFTGIGAEITQKDGQIVIVTPLEDSPAFQAGVQAGDVILLINGESSEGLTTEEAVKKIVGPEGTQVVLKLRHADGNEEELTITRRQIEIQTVKGFRRNGDQHWDFMLDAANGVGYVRLSQFSLPTKDALKKAVESATAAGMKGLILDLRFNPGGLLDQAVSVSDLFLKEGVIVSSAGRNRQKQQATATPDDDLGDFPIVVIVNEYSASASEIVAGALKDNGRAVVVGTRSFGKGSVQEVRSLLDGAGAIKVTTALYYLPSGTNLHRHEGADTWGVDPSDGFYVPMSNEQIEKMTRARLDSDVLRSQPGEAKPITPEYIENDLSDPQLAAAYRAVLGKLQTGEFPKVGRSNATLQAHLTEKGRLADARTQLEKNLVEVNERIKALEDKIEKGEPVTEAPTIPDAPAEPQPTEK